MKVKWIIALVVLYIIITMIILLSTKQAIKTELIPQKEALETNQTSNYSETFPKSISIATAPLSAIKHNITIINKPSAVEPENKIITPIENPTNQIISSNPVNTPSAASPSPEIENQNNVEVGITKIGKYPNKKEAQEMNSAGIVLY